jgi:predicted AAA+ superfamily ATPase
MALQRHLAPRLLDALVDTPVTLLVGARQTGKSTLCRAIAGHDHPARYLTFDDAATLAAAHADPAGFVGALEGPVVLDEVQRAPDLFRAIKVGVDRRRTPGQFLLTGSANVLMMPKISESLAGRMEVLTLRPFSQGEIDQTAEGFLDEVFGRKALRPPRTALTRAQVIARAVRGGYPEILQRPDPDRRRAWFGSYLTTILQRDVRDLANIDGLTQMPRLFELLAARASTLLNYAELSRSAGLPQTTLKRYIALLEATFLIHLVPAWSSNRSKRAVRMPRIVLGDTGLLAHLLGGTAETRAESASVGPLLENFVVLELLKQASWQQSRPQIFHYRTHSGDEADIVLEAPGGAIVGIEVKAAATIGASHFKGLEALRRDAGKRFHRGIVLYTGREALPFGRDLWALPLSALWNLGAR